MYFLDPGHIPQQPPRRIVSLVPSQTELLYDLGLQEETVGITKFCIHPEAWFRNKARIGGTKTIHRDKIKALQPDLIIANKEENVKEQVESLQDIAPVWMSDIHTLDDALHMIREIGSITDRSSKADDIAQRVAGDFAGLKPAGQVAALYLIWRQPWMSIGNDTFIHDMMRRIGLENVLGDRTRYPEVDTDLLRARQPELILLSSEPYPFKEQHIAELQQWVPDARIVLVDGEMFSWYGSRLLQAPDYFRNLLKTLGQGQK
jgi:ABC-type Fe3+-hydroxamate transport system substrate-binding protein